MAPRRAALGAALGIFGGMFAGAVPAGAVLNFQPCAVADAPTLECAQIEVPIDRSGNVPGTLSLQVQRIKASGASTQPPIVALAGGPGQTNTNFTPFYPHDLGTALESRDLIVFDQRGTGGTALDCPEIPADGSIPSGPAVQSCAERLGPSRNYYTTRDSADDLEDIRAAVGVDKVALYGQSYGTWVEQGYAIRHPEHVDSMVLDSTVSPASIADAFGVEQFKAAPVVATALCAHGRCKGIPGSPFGNVVALFKSLLTKPLKAKFVDPAGHVKSTSLNAGQVALLLPDLDVDAHLRAELPRAVAGARSGDPAALARLAVGGAARPPAVDLERSNATLQTATLCEEENQGFDRGTLSPDDRIAQARQGLAAVPPDTFAPFGPDLAFLVSRIPSCAYWPLLPAAPSFGSRPPANVPVLLTDGEFDLRTPLSNTQETAALFPQSSTLVVPNQGHSAVSSDVSGCAERAVQAFFKTGTKPAACKRGRDFYKPRALVPRSLRKVKPAAGFRGNPAAGRMVAAAQLTVGDALAQLNDGSRGDVNAEPKVRGGGLRAGSFKGTSKGPRLRGYVFVAGVPVSGLVTRAGTVVLKVPGGKLRFAFGGKVTGRLRGRPVSGRAQLERQTIGSKLADRQVAERRARPIAR